MAQADIKSNSFLIQEFNSLAEDAHGSVESGLACDGESKYFEALKFYKHGLEIIDKALEIRCDRPYCTGEVWNDIRNQQNKMRKARKNVYERIHEIENAMRGVNSTHFESPPTYEEAVSYPDTQTQLYPPLSGLNEIDDAFVLFCIPSGVILYEVNAAKNVNMINHCSSLYILKFGDQTHDNESSIFLLIGDWIYPLLPGTSPVLHSSTGAYMFPDALNQGASIGVILPSDIDPKLQLLFEDLLSQLTAFVTQGEIEIIKKKGPSSLPEHVSANIIKGSVLLSKGLMVGAEKVSHLVSIGSEKLKHKLDSQPSATIDPRLQKSAEVARNVTGAAVALSGYLVNAVAKGTSALGKFLYPHIHDKGSVAIAKVTGMDESESKDKLGGAMHIAAGAVQGFGNIYLGLESAAILVAKSVSENTVKVVNHRYGAEASALTENTFTTIGQTALAGRNLSGLGVKGLAKSAVKGAGKGILEEHVYVLEQEKSNGVETLAIRGVDVGYDPLDDSLSNQKKS